MFVCLFAILSATMIATVTTLFTRATEAQRKIDMRLKSPSRDEMEVGEANAVEDCLSAPIRHSRCPIFLQLTCMYNRVAM